MSADSPEVAPQPSDAGLTATALAAVPDDALLETLCTPPPIALAGLLARDWERIAARIARPDGTHPTAYAWRAAFALYWLGHSDLATEELARARVEHGDVPSDLAELQAVTASLAWQQGYPDKCRAAIAEARRLLAIHPHDRALAGVWHAEALLAASDGRRSDNARAYRAARDYAERAGDVLLQVRTENNVANSEVEEGRYAEAVRRLQHALQLNAGTPDVSGRALLRETLAWALTGLGRLDEALVEAQKARDGWIAVESPMVALAWLREGQIQAQRGNLAQAALAFRESATEAERSNDLDTVLGARTGLAQVTLGEDPARARRLVERILDDRAVLGHVAATSMAGWIALGVGDEAAARRYAARALAEASRRHDQAAIADLLELAALADGAPAQDPRLQEAASIWTSTGNEVRAAVNAAVVASLAGRPLEVGLARERLRTLGVHADAWTAAGPLRSVGAGPRHPVQIHALGSFVVYRDGVPVTSADWPSRKARALLKLLVGAGPAGLTRDHLCELLWPGDPAGGSKLSVALSQLRSVLDPERSIDPDAFVRADRQAVRLDLDLVSVDVEEFRAAAEQALAAAAAGLDRAADLLTAAAALHSGAFLAQDLYEDWAAEPREAIERLGAEVVRALVTLLAAGEAPAAALPWVVRLLGQDPYDEPMHVLHVQLLHRARRHGEARRAYASYAARMAEIDTPVEPWEGVVAP
ncbi:hypothetical protein DDE18_11100 [Nocardioides gansuensis]|uniref:Bacterial transcriptional activator domain-containing protein n=1 Tax=Nocardioides gansuensis TaxID=2138300 RepID=A0A2T8FAY9_9ACTN|nr:BTAD domain-containing putative transcriptional regulator [Nocardioides gansuensis]PVG82891.1 hypothetical protein DDE18_11100 [Nocardioides gansuensis]